jgi:phage FluMu gp28-like protein
VTDTVLLPYQQRWLADRSRVRLAEKSRRIGWSWATAAEVTLDAARARGCDAWYVGYNKEMAQEFIRDCAFWARGYNMAASDVEESLFEDDDPDKKILTYSITFASGYRVTALSSRPTNLRNKRGHLVLDEAAFHDDLPGLIKAAMAILMWGGSARVDIISTHNGTDNFFFTLTEEVRAGKRPSWSLHRCTIDDALAQGLFKRICMVNGWEWSPEREAEWRRTLFADYGDAAQEELLCVPARSGGVYLPRDLIERQMKPGTVVRLALPDGFVSWKETARVGHIEQWLVETVLPLLGAMPKDKLSFLGMDFGRVSDRSVIVPGYLAQDLVRKVPWCVELLNVPFDQQRQVLHYIIDRLPRFTKAALDATGNGAHLAELTVQRYGEAHILPVSMTSKWYAEELPPFKAALEDKLCELIRDADHLIDLSHFKVVEGLPRLPKSKTDSATSGVPRHGDAGIAYALMHHASRQPAEAFSYQPVVGKKTRHDPTMNARGPVRKKGGML